MTLLCEVIVPKLVLWPMNWMMLFPAVLSHEHLNFWWSLCGLMWLITASLIVCWVKKMGSWGRWCPRKLVGAGKRLMRSTQRARACWGHSAWRGTRRTWERAWLPMRRSPSSPTGECSRPCCFCSLAPVADLISSDLISSSFLFSALKEVSIPPGPRLVILDHIQRYCWQQSPASPS